MDLAVGLPYARAHPPPQVAMPLKPVPTRPAGRRTPAATLGALAPVAALGAVVLLAWAGALADAPAARESPRPSHSSGPIVATSSDEPRATDGRAPLPTVAFGLTVFDVEGTLERLRSGEIGSGLVAVAGFLTVDPRDRDCSAAGIGPRAGAFCLRSAILTGFAEPILEVNWDENGSSAIRLGTSRPHLHPQILPGTAIPEELVATPDPRVRELAPVRAVVIGRFGDPRAHPCHPGRRHCGEEFVLERLAWAGGRWMTAPLVRDPSVPTTETAGGVDIPRLIAAREADRSEAIMSRALVSVPLLRVVHPDAVATLAGPVAGPVWYVRSITRIGGVAREAPVTWVIVDNATGDVLAASPGSG